MIKESPIPEFQSVKTQSVIWKETRMHLLQIDHALCYHHTGPLMKHYPERVRITARNAIRILRRAKVKRKQIVKYALIEHLHPYIQRETDTYGKYYLEKLQEKLESCDDISALSENWFYDIMNDYNCIKFPGEGVLDTTVPRKPVKPHE